MLKWNNCPQKVHLEIDAKINAETVMKIDEKQCGIGTEIHEIFNVFRNVVSRKIEFSEKGVPTQTSIFMQQNKGPGGFAENVEN